MEKMVAAQRVAADTQPTQLKQVLSELTAIEDTGKHKQAALKECAQGNNALLK